MSERVRTGKIARLPHKIREKLNRRLHNGETGKALVEWLNRLPKVKAMLKKHFGGNAINEQNMSEWVQGGYSDWQLQQQAVEAVERMDDDAGELKQASKTPIIDLLMRQLAARYAIAMRTLNRPGKPGQMDVQLLHELCRDIIALQRSDHSIKLVDVERARMTLERDKLHEMQEEEFLTTVMYRQDEVLDYIRDRLLSRADTYQRVGEDDTDLRQEAQGVAELQALSAALDKEKKPKNQT